MTSKKNVIKATGIAKDWLLNMDMFGITHPITYDTEDVSRSWVGGIMSVLLKVFFFGYVVSNLISYVSED